MRGDYAHHVLQRVYSELAGAAAGAGSRAENLPEAERLLIDALRDFQAEFPISPDRTRVRTAVRKLEFDLLRYLRDEADSTTPRSSRTSSSCRSAATAMSGSRSASTASA